MPGRVKLRILLTDCFNYVYIHFRSLEYPHMIWVAKDKFGGKRDPIGTFSVSFRDLLMISSKEICRSCGSLGKKWVEQATVLL
jgi:hypothetical protein